MAAKSTNADNLALNWLLGTGTPTRPAACYVGLLTAFTSPNTLTEVAGGSYARQSATFAAAASGQTTNSVVLNFTGMPAVTVVGFAIFDASTAGNVIYAGALTANKTTNAGDTFTFPSGTGLTISES